MTKTDQIMRQVAILVDVENGTDKCNGFHETYDKLRTMVEDAVKGHARYEYVRMLNAREFGALCRENITMGIPFDDLVDRAILIEGNVNEN